MAGIYIHVPFCKRRCIYCDFYSTTQSHLQQAYTDAVCRELELRRNYLAAPVIDTVYIGGGTPSQLPVELLSRIFRQIKRLFRLSPEAEITLECNPDDISGTWLEQIRSLPVNRLSLGVQTFNDRLLQFLQRRHTGLQARQAVQLCQQAGFDNISIDLIYGLPGQTCDQWRQDIDHALHLQVQHLSAYALIYEENTKLWRLRQQGTVSEVGEETSLSMFNTLIDHLGKNGFEHYEISNFARPGYLSRHNSSYWQDIPYLGCGPAAHSFNGKRRQWNRPDLTGYLTALQTTQQENGNITGLYEYEDLTATERYNERIITGLRTRWGVNLHRLRQDFGAAAAAYCLQTAAPHIRQGNLQRLSPTTDAPEGTLRLTRQGIFVSDAIMSDLLQVED